MTGELASIGTAFTWAVASLVFARLSSKASPLSLNLLKCAVAAALLVPTLLVLEGASGLLGIGAADAARVAASGVLGLALADTLYFRALARMGPKRAAVLIALVPPATALLAAAVVDEALSAPMVAGMALTLCGVAVVVLAKKQGDEAPIGDADLRSGLSAGLGYVLCQAVTNVLLKDVGPTLSPLAITTARLALGAVVLALVIAARRELGGSLRALAAPGVRGPALAATIVGTYVGVWLSVHGIRHAKVGVATTLAATTPLFVLLLARVVLRQRAGTRAVIGAVVAVLGVAVLLVFPT